MLVDFLYADPLSGCNALAVSSLKPERAPDIHRLPVGVRHIWEGNDHTVN